MFNTGPLFAENYNRLWKPKDPSAGKAKIIINQGGTDSGKTYTIIQLLCFIAATHPIPNNGDLPVISILSESVPNAKKGPYRIFEMLEGSNSYLRNAIKHWNKGGRVIEFYNVEDPSKTGWIMEFVPAIDEQNAKQGKRQYLFVNEAQSIPWMIFWQMAKKTRIAVYIDYNPTAPFWAHDKLISCPYPEANDLFAKVRLIISDHRHNPFLSSEEHARTENIKDPELHRVYARGLTGNMTGIIYPNWTMIPKAEFDNIAGIRFGAVDFGYTNDPTAGVVIKKVKKKIYVHEICYEPGIPDRAVRNLFRKVYKFGSETPVYCEKDLATIREFRLMNLMAIPAEKGPVWRGIHKMKKDYEFFYTSTSKNLMEELKRYQWMKDPDTNLPTNEPIDAHNHLLDAIRYGVLTHAKRHHVTS